ncbi:MAG TPA: CPBP family intramembrane glutamic endopeptidase [Terracidiphilus sp.]|nr:CPBP family intramembrane glutamic endopeptidase [Terracidiphilus sp.]
MKSNSMLGRHPVTAYFTLTFLLSWLGASAVAAPGLLRHHGPDKMTGILMFPAMILGPCVVSLILTAKLEGRAGLRELGQRIFLRPRPAVWLLALLIPPVLILAVLEAMQRIVSAAYSPNYFWIGVLFGVPAGLLEEVGWTGFAFPRMQQGMSPFAASILLGMLWSCWHLPVVNFLGTATPHGRYWPLYFAVFAVAMTAMRVLIGWVYMHTQSVLMAQLMHMSSTGSLVVLSAVGVSALQECAWYAAYGTALWAVVLAIRMRDGAKLVRPPRL